MIPCKRVKLPLWPRFLQNYSNFNRVTDKVKPWVDGQHSCVSPVSDPPCFWISRLYVFRAGGRKQDLRRVQSMIFDFCDIYLFFRSKWTFLISTWNSDCTEIIINKVNSNSNCDREFIKHKFYCNWRVLPTFLLYIFFQRLEITIKSC